MTRLISSVTSKPKWQEKIHDEVIRSKWVRELVEQGVGESVVEMALNLICSHESKTGKAKDDLLGKYSWFVRSEFEAYEILGGMGCDCLCINCDTKGVYKDNEYSDDDESEEDADEDNDDTRSTSRPSRDPRPLRPHIVCKCADISSFRQNKFLKRMVKEFFGLIDSRVSSEFRRLVASLPREYHHPGTDKMAVDVIHPSINCYIKGVTPLSDPSVMIPKVDPKDKWTVIPEPLFQWLPSEVSVDEAGNVRFDSYINNLDPANTEMYSAIADILKQFVQPFRDCLKNLKDLYAIDEVPSLDHFQVIVKVQELELTPEKPGLPAGSWHLEGTVYEHIVATGIYYYEMDNVQENTLSFKVGVENAEGIVDTVDELRWLELHVGLEKLRSQNYYNCMHLGSIKTKQDLCVVFPNVLPHRVGNITLADKTKSGSRKILVFWLIDPAQPILSTAQVPQQHLPPKDAQLFEELLMYQRKFFTDKDAKEYERTFTLCEH